MQLHALSLFTHNTHTCLFAFLGFPCVKFLIAKFHSGGILSSCHLQIAMHTVSTIKWCCWGWRYNLYHGLPWIAVPGRFIFHNSSKPFMIYIHNALLEKVQFWRLTLKKLIIFILRQKRSFTKLSCGTCCREVFTNNFSEFALLMRAASSHALWTSSEANHTPPLFCTSMEYVWVK